MRFAVGVLRDLDLETIGPVTLLGPADAPWRTRAAVPKALRDTVAVVPDAGPASRAQALAAGRIALIATPEDALGPALREAMSTACAVVAPLSAAVDEAVVHGVDALVLPPFTREAWSRTVAELVADRAGGRPSAAVWSARARAGTRTWADEAGELAAAYRDAIEACRPRRGGTRARRTCTCAPARGFRRPDRGRLRRARDRRRGRRRGPGTSPPRVRRRPPRATT